MQEMNEFRHISRDEKAAHDAFISHGAAALYQYLQPVMLDAYQNIPSPVGSRRSYESESLLASDINDPSERGDGVALPLAVSLKERGLRVESADLPTGFLGAYDGAFIRYRKELSGILRASVIAHEAAHHFSGDSPDEEQTDGDEAIAEGAAMLALRAFNIDTSAVSIPYIAHHIARTADTNGYILWNPNTLQNGLPNGVRQMQSAASKIILAVKEGQLLLRGR